MACACIKANGFDLNFDYVNTNTIIIEDFSTWVYSEIQDIPNVINMTIESLDRGYKTNLELKTNCKNKVTSLDILGEDLGKIPDGFFCITTESCGISYTINRVFLHNSEIMLMKMIAKESDKLDSEMLEIINEGFILIEAIKINSNLGNLEVSKKLFKKLKRKLQNFRCDEC